jgi:predicted DNA binding protein
MKVTYFTIKICRQLSQDKQSIEKLQDKNLRLTEKLIIAFKWLDKKITNDKVLMKTIEATAQVTVSIDNANPQKAGEEQEEAEFKQLTDSEGATHKLQ